MHQNLGIKHTRLFYLRGIVISFTIYLTSFVILFTILPSRVSAQPEAQLLHLGTGLDVGNELSSPLAIFFDAKHNECYVADTGNNQIVIFDDNGLPIHRFYHHVTKNGERILGEPRGIVVDADGRIFVTDAMAPYLNVLDALGRPIGTVDPPDDSCDAQECFEHIALAPDGRIYATVTCDKNRKIAIIGPDLEIERVMRFPPEGESRPCLTAIAVDKAGRIYLADACATTIIQIYDNDGNYVMGFGHHNTGFENFSLPVGIAVMPNGDMWIVDTLRQVVSHFSPQGEFLTYIGGPGHQPGALGYPTGIATDGKDRLFVVEKAGKRYQCFRILADRSPGPEGEKKSDAMHSSMNGGR
jgi:DNA-binding beta-propeller fold protein YncE